MRSGAGNQNLDDGPGSVPLDGRVPDEKRKFSSVSGSTGDGLRGRPRAPVE